MSNNPLKPLVDAKKGMIVPGAFNALSARIIADLGYQALYVTGAGVTNMHFAMPDLGFIGLSDIAEQTRRIRDAVDIPIIVDADTGFGNALNTYHSVRLLEKAGANAIQLEDQVAPKRCGHFAGKQVISQSEAVDKIKAAVDSRENDCLIIARTDAAAVEGFEAAVERANRYAEAGADILFVEAVTEKQQIADLPKLIAAPQLMNMVIGGKTPIFDANDLADLGYGIVLYANAALQSAVHGMQQALTTLRDEKALLEQSGLVAPFSERQRLVNKPYWDNLEKQYS